RGRRGRQPGAGRQPAGRPDGPAPDRLPPARLRRPGQRRAAVPERLRHPGFRQPRRRMAQPASLPADVPRPAGRGVRRRRPGAALFELCYQKDFADCARIISRQYDGSFDRFWEDFRSRPYDKGGDFVVINTYAMAAAYSADADGTIHFPFDLTTGQLVPEVWD